ncbi:MAG: acyl-CoA thioesterase [Chlamydiae bacterium]|nr:acyl-CoA thioesterase [Chlamydiota bacterium]
MTIPPVSLTATLKMEVSPLESLVDQEVVIVLRGLQPQEKIQVQAQTVDDSGIPWKSYGIFQANGLGIIDLSKQAPSEGSYQEIDPMGLFWSMQPEHSGLAFKIENANFSVEITAFREKEKIASQNIIRFRKAADVKRISIHEDGLVGILFVPPSDKPLPMIITLTGSSGGFGENRAQLLASHGFVVLALGYFGVDGLSSDLQNIPFEYFETAFKWIKRQPAIDSSHIGIYGVSRGAELALLLGCTFPEPVQAIAAVVPSSVVYGGSSGGPVDAWLYHGKRLAPFAPVGKENSTDNKGLDRAYPILMKERFLEGMKDTKAFEAAVIPVEKMQASLLLISGGDDQMWPSALYVTQIQERLKAYKSSICCEHLCYPKAGHGISIPNFPAPGPIYYHPVGKQWFSMGGTIADDQDASLDSWKKLIAFFQKTLKEEGP